MVIQKYCRELFDIIVYRVRAKAVELQREPTVFINAQFHN